MCFAEEGSTTEDNDYVEGGNISCPHDDCKKNFSCIYCSHCSKAVQFVNNEPKSKTYIGKDLVCGNTKCAKTFRAQGIHTKEWTEGKTFVPVQGVVYNFINPSKDSNEVRVCTSLINIDWMYKNYKEQIIIDQQQSQLKENLDKNPVSGNNYYLIIRMYDMLR